MAVRVRARTFLLGLFVVVVAACGGSADTGGGAASPTSLYVIKFPHVVAPATPKGQMAQRFKEMAAPMIVHPVFTLLGLNDGTATIGEGLIVIALYVVLGITALAIDRRALLVSALAYVLYALSELFKQVGAVELNIALTALVIGSALLLLSAFWHQARSIVVRQLPETLRAKLPLTDRTVIPQPAA